MIVFSVDIDWAIEEVIADTLMLFEQYNVKCTLFATHDSEKIKFCNRDIFEVAIHPNFNFLLEGKGGSYKAVIEDLLNIYPEAMGVRSHSITQSSPIIDFFAEKGLIYDANNIMPYQKNVVPFLLWNGLLKIPYVWEDDVHWDFGYTFDEIGIDLFSSDINVFAFHPIHIFLNTSSGSMYDKIRPHYKSYDKLKENINTKVVGVRDALIRLLEHTNKYQTNTSTLYDIAKTIKSNKKYV